MDADELVGEIGRGFLEALNNKAWDDFVFVGEVRKDGHSGYGFLYGADGSARSWGPGVKSPLYQRMRELHDAMGGDWQFCVVRIQRATAKLSIDFERDPAKWKMSPSRLEELKEKLRPKA